MPGNQGELYRENKQKQMVVHAKSKQTVETLVGGMQIITNTKATAEKHQLLYKGQTLQVTEEELDLFQQTRHDYRVPYFEPVDQKTYKKMRLRQRKKYDKQKEEFEQNYDEHEANIAAKHEKAFRKLVAARRHSEAQPDMLTERKEKIAAENPDLSDEELELKAMDEFSLLTSRYTSNEATENKANLQAESKAFWKMMQSGKKVQLPDNEYIGRKGYLEYACPADAIYFYCGPSYKTMNWMLRNPGKEMPVFHSDEEFHSTKSWNKKQLMMAENDDQEKARPIAAHMIDLAKTGLAGVPLSRTTVVRRGTNRDALMSMLGLKDVSEVDRTLNELANQEHPEKLIVDKGFVSTAQCIGESGYYNSAFNGDVQMVIKANKGTEAINIADTKLEAISGEQELLLAPNVPMKLLKVKRITKTDSHGKPVRHNGKKQKVWKMYFSTITKNAQGNQGGTKK